MDNKGLISVIIPVYNVEKYLCECVDSVLNQTYSEYEIILIDDGSTDSSGKICDDYANKNDKIKVIHKKNGGLSMARNDGMSVATGEYIYFLDSDDYISADALEKLISNIQTNNSDFVFFDAKSFKGNDTSKNFGIKQKYIRQKKYNTDIGYSIFNQLQQNNEFHSVVYLFLFRKEFLTSNNLIFIPDILHEDMIFTYEAFCKASRVSQCADALYFRRYRSNSIMTSKKSQKHFDGCLSVYSAVSEFSKAENLISSKTAQTYISRCAFNVFNVYEKLSRQDKKACKNKLNKTKKYIKSDNYYSNPSLFMRCKGKLFWYIYKIYEKTLGRLLKG